ncbi:MAG TPA: DUF4160 domain-containing protein [Solirubrobacterales bacterium]|jgi:hypothetical protein|nr:DUF4160 domain-containing protein [Solirubrobacterales bacterium]
MPRISSFYGIVIAMYYREHGPPHFHVRYADCDACIDIETSRLLVGWLPPRALRLVREWASLHRDELAANWDRARAEAPLNTIEPLP